MPTPTAAPDRPRDESRTHAPLLLALAACVALVVLLRVHRDWIAAEPTPHWDEALHLLLGELLAEDLRQGDAWAWSYDAYRMSGWPPLHASILGLAFALAGPSFGLGRFLSLFSFAGAIALVGLLAHRIAPRPAAVAPAVAMILLATSYGLAPFAGQAMLEVFGLFVLGLALLAFELDARREGSAATQVGLAAASIATYLARINFGLLLVGALGADALLEIRRVGWREALRRRWIVATLWLGFLLVWFVHPAKRAATWRRLRNIPSTHPGAPDDPSFALWAFVETAGWLVLAALVVVLCLWRRWKVERVVRFLVIVTVLQLGLVAFHRAHQMRHGFPAVPPAAALCAWLAAEGARRALAGGRGPARPAIVAGSILLLAAFRLAPLAGPAERFPAPWKRRDLAVTRQLGAAIDRLAGGQRFFLLSHGQFAAVDAPTLDWVLVVERGVLEPSRAGALGEIGRGDSPLRLLAGLAQRGVALPGMEKAIRRSTSADLSRSVYLRLPYQGPKTLAALESLLVRLEISRYPTVILATSPDRVILAPAAELRAMLGRFGLAVDHESDVGGARLERFVHAEPGAGE